MKDSPAASPSTNALPAPSGRTSQFSPFNKTNPWLPEYHSAEMRNAHPGRAALRRPRSGANCDRLFSRASPGRSAVLTRHRRLAGLVPCGHGSALKRRGWNLLLLQFLGARAQGVSDNYVVDKTKTLPGRRLCRARDPGPRRQLPWLLREPNDYELYDQSDEPNRPARRHDTNARLRNRQRQQPNWRHY